MSKEETQTENKKTVLLDTETAKIINEQAEKEGISPEETLSKIVRAYLDKLKAEDKKCKANKVLKSSPDFITIPVDLYEPYVDFLQQYLNFFGSKQKLEDLCRQMIYDQANYLHDKLQDFVGEQGSFLDSTDFYWKYSVVGKDTSEKEEAE
jgi:hypothetical protein